mmetsp:Transcript_25193/g.35499  ORF Transcript_25193/g.35499 Transcript_25193/m.35499 type:complete len:117 (+) Transcript_25193:123-473(+)
MESYTNKNNQSNKMKPVKTNKQKQKQTTSKPKQKQTNTQTHLTRNLPISVTMGCGMSHSKNDCVPITQPVRVNESANRSPQTSSPPATAVLAAVSSVPPAQPGGASRKRQQVRCAH